MENGKWKMENRSQKSGVRSQSQKAEEKKLVEQITYLLVIF